MLDPTVKDNARKAAGIGAATTAGALRSAGDASARAASTLADSLDRLASGWAPTESCKARKWVGGTLAFLVVVGLIAFLVRRRRENATADTAEGATTDLDTVRDQRSAS
jgi:hypothetical protein